MSALCLGGIQSFHCEAAWFDVKEAGESHQGLVAGTLNFNSEST